MWHIYIPTTHRAECSQSASLREDQKALDYALISLYWWLVLLHSISTHGRSTDWADVYGEVCASTHVNYKQIFFVMTGQYQRPLLSITSHIIIVSICPFSLHSLPSPGEAHLTEWSAFPKQTWKATAITAKSCLVLYLTVRVKADGGEGQRGLQSMPSEWDFQLKST